MCDLLLRQYDSDARQLSVQSELESTTLEAVMVRENLTDLQRGLSRLIETVEHLTPQCTPAFRSERNKIRFLRSAVLLQPWAKPAISQITVANYDFHQFATALHEGLTLAIETKEHTGALQRTTLMHRQAALS